MKIINTFLISLIFLIQNISLFSAEYISPEATLKRNTLISVMVFGGIIGVILVIHAMRTSNVRKKQEGVQESGAESIMPAIINEVKGLDRSSYKYERVASKIYDLVQERINSVTHELGEKYENIIKEKQKAELSAVRKYEETLGEKKQTEAIVRSIAEGLVVVDDRGRVLLMNPAAERLLGLKKEQKIGKSLLADVKDEQLFTLVKDISDGTQKEVELKSVQDSTRRTLRASSAVIEDENGKTVGMVSVLSDVTKQKELDQVKADFTSSVTHELRTPIETLKNSVSLILSGDTGPITEMQKKFLAISERNIKRLSTLIDSMLDAAKIQERKVELLLEPCAVGDIIYEVCETLNAWVMNKSINISIDIQADIPKTNLDREKIVQVLNNLIGNAIKYSPKGGSITVSARTTEDKEGIEICVADTGPGISKGDLQKVFDKFYRGGARMQTDISGTGLGLYITKEIVELHGGKIWAESEEREGARFTFSLPVKEMVIKKVSSQV